jgi:hypothetical protein
VAAGVDHVELDREILQQLPEAVRRRNRWLVVADKLELALPFEIAEFDDFVFREGVVAGNPVCWGHWHLHLKQENTRNDCRAICSARKTETIWTRAARAGTPKTSEHAAGATLAFPPIPPHVSRQTVQGACRLM